MAGIEYAAIARDSTILVSLLRSNEDLETISRTVLPQIPKYNTKTAYTLQGYEFLAIVYDGIIYLCGMRPEFGRRLAFHFLESIRRKFTSGSLGYRAINAVEHELDRDFVNVLEDEMDRFGEGDGDNITQLNRQVEEVKGVMKNNIEKVLERGDKIDALLDKASDLELNSNRFKTKSRTLHRKMYCKNVKMWLIIAFVLIVIVLVIILFSTNIINIHGNPSKSTPIPATTPSKLPPTPNNLLSSTPRTI